MQTSSKTAVKHSTPRIAYGYARVSTVDQIEGESLAVQQEKIRALATLHGFTLAGIFVDGGVSASKPLRQRPEGRKLWKALHPGGAVIATRLDRAFRNQTDALATLDDCKRNNISLVLGDLGGDCTQGSVAALIFSIMSATSTFERHRIAERIVDAKQAQKTRGEYLGGSAPFGYRIVESNGARKVEADARLQTHVLDLHLRDFSSRMIAAELKTKDGISVSGVTVCKFLRLHARAAA